jgi:hypothetical protein
MGNNQNVSWVDAYYYRKSVDDGEALEAEDKNYPELQEILNQLNKQTWLDDAGADDESLDPDLDEVS